MNAIELFLNFPFLQRALLAALVAAILCAVLGVLVVLRGLSMLGDGLAHISFAGFALGLALSIYPLGMALVAAVLGALAIQFLRERGIVKGDAAIGIVFIGGLALGVIIVSATHGFNVDIMSIIFGSVFAVRETDILLILGIGLTLVAGLAFLYKEFFYLTFSEEAARVSGLPVGALNVILTVLTAASIVMAARVVGILLVSALLIVPASSAFQFARSFRGALILAVGFGITSVLVGMWAAVQFDLATGGSVAFTAVTLFGASLLAKETVRRVRGTA